MKGSNIKAMENKEDYVLIDKNTIRDLCENGIKNGWELILYCKIYSMSAYNGFCNATNKYFADFLCTTERSIQRYIRSLKDNGYIKIYELRNGSHTESRKIYPQKGYINKIENNTNIPTTESDIPTTTLSSTHDRNEPNPRQKVTRPMTESDLTHDNPVTQVIDSNRIVIDSSKDAAAVALLDVADAPKRCATLAHQKSEWKFDGAFLDKDMLGIIRRECEKLYPEYQSGSSDFSDIHELREYLLEKYSDAQGYYRCKNIDELESCINALLCNAQ